MKKRSDRPAANRGLRWQARKRLRDRAISQTTPGAHFDAARIVQELEIHQIELELQNEELKHAKAEVEKGLEKYTDLYDFAPVGYFSLDARGAILEANLTGTNQLGIERSRLIGRRFQLFVAPSSRPAVNAFLLNIFAERRKQTCEAALLKGGHMSFWTSLEASPSLTFGGDPEWCRVAVIDITARRRAEEERRRNDILTATNLKLEEEIARRRAGEAALIKSERRAHELLAKSQLLQKQLRQLTRQSLTVQEKQRKQISRELHDKISQLLLGINVHLAAFTRAATLNPRDVHRTVGPLRRLVAKSVRVVHQFAKDLRPAMLDDLGLAPALRNYIRDLPKRKGLRIEFLAEIDSDELNNDERTAFYRIAQEAITNVYRHARATVVKVALRDNGQGVCLRISDNGRGFDPRRLLSTEWSNHLGLTGMRERAEMLGGQFRVVSAPGKGTTIEAEVPPGRA